MFSPLALGFQLAPWPFDRQARHEGRTAIHVSCPRRSPSTTLLLGALHREPVPGLICVYVSNGMFMLDADEHLPAAMIPFAKYCKADATSHQSSATQKSIACSCRYDPIWKALQGRCHFAPTSCYRSEHSILLQIRSHLESIAEQMPSCCRY